MRESIRAIAGRHDTDKSTSTAHLDIYERLFANFRDSEVYVLELGVFRGGSLLLWRDYFERGSICGIDLVLPIGDFGPRVHMHQGAQDDRELLNRARRQSAPNGFDIVIDDGAHVGSVSYGSLCSIFLDHLNPGGIYIIEDWGTGYWGNWPDGQAYREPTIAKNQIQTHDFGMVGLVKSLIDHVGRSDVTRSGMISNTNGFLPIKSLEVHSGMIILLKEEDGGAI